jgi:hypothetical protein
LADPATVKTDPVAAELKPFWLTVSWYCVFQFPVKVTGAVTFIGEAGPVPPVETNWTPAVLLGTVAV